MLSDLASLSPRDALKRAAWMAERAADALEELVDELLGDAFELWLAQSLVRVSDEEPCCAVVFYGCCRRVLESQETILRILPEADQPTRQMLAGIEHPKNSARPDMTVLLGRYTIRIEAKRLMPGQGLPKKYVQEGMRRFIDGKYSSTSGKAGYMLGFVVSGETAAVVSAINQAIIAEADLGLNDHLAAVTVPRPRFTRYESTHVNKLRLVHNFLDVRLK
jgi:hypothetical protein